MRFTISATAVLAMAMSAFAQTPDFDPIYTPEANAIIEAGSTFDITWAAPAKYADGTVSISLIGGATQNTQVPLQDIASGVPNSANKYTWTVDASLGADAVYGLIVRYESSPEIFQYSNPFHIKAAASQPDKSTSAPAESTDAAATTVTTQHGAVTVTLSSCTTSEAVSTSAPVVNTTSEAPVYTTPVPVYSTSAPVHQNTTLSTVKPVVPSTSVTVVNPPASSSTGVTPPPTGAASAHSVSGALALVAGLAMAMLAL